MMDGSGRAFDTTGAFMVGELERLDMTMHQPLVTTYLVPAATSIFATTITIGDEISSFTLTTFGAAGGLGTGQGIGNGKAWVGKSTNQISGVSVDSGQKNVPARHRGRRSSSTTSSRSSPLPRWVARSTLRSSRRFR